MKMASKEGDEDGIECIQKKKKSNSKGICKFEWRWMKWKEKETKNELFCFCHFTHFGVFHSRVSRSLSDNKSPQVSKTLLSILVDLSNAVFWKVSTLPLISKSSSHCTNPLVSVPRVPIITSIDITFMLHSFFQFPRKVQLLIFLFAFLQFYIVVCRNSKVHYSAGSLFFFVDYHKIWSSGRE